MEVLRFIYAHVWFKNNMRIIYMYESNCGNRPDCSKQMQQPQGRCTVYTTWRQWARIWYLTICSVNKFQLSSWVASALQVWIGSYIFYVMNVHGHIRGILRGDYCTFDYFTEYFTLSRNGSVMEVLHFMYTHVWFKNNMRIFLVKSRSLKCSLDAAKRGFYRAANSILAKLGASSRRKL